MGDKAAWSGRAAWSGDITRHRAGLLPDLKLPADTGPAQWRLTQFDDQWPYARAAGDVYFSRAANQQLTQRSSAPGGFQFDLALTGFLALAALRPFRRRRHGQPTVEIPARDSAEPAGSGVPREPSARWTGAPFARGTHPDLRRVRRGTPRTAGGTPTLPKAHRSTGHAPGISDPN